METQFAEEILSSLKKFVDQKLNESLLKFYPGKVEDNNDPDKLGRCKIRVHGIFDPSIATEDLPWAYPDQTFVGSLVGNFIVPPVNALVNVYFDHGDLYEPRYTTKVLDAANFSFKADIDDDYPDTMVFFESDAGDYFKVNRRTGEMRLKSSSGAVISVDQNGSIRITTTGSDTGDLNVTLEGNCSIDAQGTVSVKSLISASVDAPIVTVQAPSGGTVAPNPVGGPFNCLPVDPITGVPHQGNVFLRA